MRFLLRFLAVVSLAGGRLAAQSAAAPVPTEVAPGVFVFTPNNTTDLFVEGNTTVVIGTKAVLVIDAPSVRLSREHVRWIRSKTTVPIRYLVDTHWHLDHVSGNQVYAQELSGVEIIATAETRRQIDSEDSTYLTQWQGYTPQVLDQERQKLLRARKTMKDPDDGTPITPFDIQHNLDALAYAARERPTWLETHLVDPTVTFDDRMTLDLGDREVQLRQYVGHTTGDAVIYLPRDSVLITGDLVVAPVPYGINSHFYAWSESLRQLEATYPIKVIVPGHGDVLSSWDYVHAERALVDALLAQVEAAMRAGFKQSNQVDSVKKHVDLSQFERQLAGNDSARQWGFKHYFVDPGVPRAFEEIHVAAF